ncbi:endonuclease domain-containing 1 protein isoform X1 [Gadus chalcogrammus]|uniref:endonuclease domain-containing 1 protein isoform X1 n=2 Tax=Gadus chalcogrammus TaxID=1042646 RepID=UPI0024C4ADE2|nr:endonuclease domain-containing 1 protein isoform X1 [Gadus chalcogrammus]
MGRKEAALPGSSAAPDHGGGMPLFKACLLSLQLLMGPSLAVASVFLSFRDCSHFFHKRTPPLVVHGASLKSICQRFRDKARYATLYDGGRRLALYSAYVFKKSDGQGRADTPWMYEPQLVSEDGGDNMRELPLSDDALALEDSQAVLEDYTDAAGYERGPLNPDQHQAEPDDKSSTYTLTNVVPLATAFLDACWNPYLDAIRRRLNNFCHGNSYVVTGATVSGSAALWRERRERVAIPKHLWLAYCCPWFDRNSPHEVRFMFPSYGSYALNQATGNEVVEVPLKDLESFLTHQTDVDHDLAVFPKGCLAEDLFKRGKRQNP